MEEPKIELSNIENRLQAIESEIASIKNRNKSVEGDKAWEMSGARKVILGCIIFLLTALIMMIIKAENIMFSAIIAGVGFMVFMRYLL